MKYFTYCVSDRGAVENSGQWTYRRRSHSAMAGGLLFGTHDGTPLTDDDVNAIANDSKITEILGERFIITPLKDGRVVATTTTDFAPLPDEVQIDSPPLTVQLGKPDASGQMHLPVIQQGALSVSLHERWNACPSMIKRSLGCGECPDKNTTCLTSYIPQLETLQLSRARLPGNYFEDREDLKHGKTKIADFTYVSPVMTRDDHFDKNIRYPNEHDFGKVVGNSEMRSQSRKLATKRQEFKKTECVACPVQSYCNRYRHCNGKYPDEATITKQVMAQLYKELSTSTVQRWQLESALVFAGKQGHNGSRATVFGGPARGDNGFRFVSWYAKRPVSRATSTDEYAKIAELYDLPRTEEQYQMIVATRPTDLEMSLWYMSLQERYRYVRMAYGSACQDAAVRAISYRGLVISYATSRGMENTYGIRNYAEFYGRFGALPGVQKKNDDPF